MHKEIKVSQCQNARHLEAAGQTKDGCTNVHIHRAFLLSLSLQAIHLLVLLSLHRHINSRAVLYRYTLYLLSGEEERYGQVQSQ